jgi:hypothetical protein
VRVSSLNEIVRGLLLKEGKPLHYYFQYLKYACDGLQELHFDTMKCVSTKKLLVNSYQSVSLPCDYVDWVKVGVEIGQYVKPITQRNTLNRLNNYDTDGNKTSYASTDSEGTQTEISNVAWFATRVNDHGEHTGGMYNHIPGFNSSSFKVLREREEIQLDGTFASEYIILEYITDGQEADAATKVHPYARRTIEAYIRWQYLLHNRNAGNGDRIAAKMEFDAEHRKLRGRLSDLTLTDIYNAFLRGYSGTYKN